jgi:hypothetical protein
VKKGHVTATVEQASTTITSKGGEAEVS